MQTYSESFKRQVIEVLSGPCTVIGTVFFDEHPWIDEFKLRDEVNIIEITKENRDKLPSEIVSALQGYISG